MHKQVQRDLSFLDTGGIKTEKEKNLPQTKVGAFKETCRAVNILERRNFKHKQKRAES